MTTQARAVLAAHIEKLKAQAAAYEQARQPIVDLDARIEAARGEQLAAELAHDHAVKQEALAFIGGDDATAATAEVNTRAADLDRARRQLAALVANRAEIENAFRDASLSQNVTSSGTEILVANVCAEESDSIVAEIVDHATKLAAAQAKAKTLAAYAVSKRWFPLAEKVNTAINTMKVPTWQSSPVPNWEVFTKALETDAGAPIPAVQS